MNKDQLNKKLTEIKIKEQALDTLLPLKGKLSSKVRESVHSNNSAFLVEVIGELSEKIETHNFDQVIEAIENIEGNEKVVNELGNLIKEIKKLSKKEYFDKDEFEDVFARQIEKIVSLLVDQNQIPNEVKYSRNSNGHIRKIIETFDSYTLTHTWKYDSNKNLISVKTVKDATE